MNKVWILKATNWVRARWTTRKGAIDKWLGDEESPLSLIQQQQPWNYGRPKTCFGWVNKAHFHELRWLYKQNEKSSSIEITSVRWSVLTESLSLREQERVLQLKLNSNPLDWFVRKMCILTGNWNVQRTFVDKPDWHHMYACAHMKWASDPYSIGQKFISSFA